MDADKVTAARKLPQTAANYFVGTNSRVPRMTLAQSSHTIPIPAPRSPGLPTSPGKAPGRLKAMSVPKTPTSNVPVSSPRSPLSERGKVAKAVQLFSSLPNHIGDDTTSDSAVDLPTFFLVPQAKDVWERPASTRSQRPHSPGGSLADNQHDSDHPDSSAPIGNGLSSRPETKRLETSSSPLPSLSQRASADEDRLTRLPSTPIRQSPKPTCSAERFEHDARPSRSTEAAVTMQQAAVISATHEPSQPSFSSEPIESLIFEYTTGEDDGHDGRTDVQHRDQDSYHGSIHDSDADVTEEPVDPFSILDAGSAIESIRDEAEECEADPLRVRDSFIERTTSWIKNTIQEGAATPTEASNHDHEEGKTASVASIASPDSAEVRTQTDRLPLQLDSRQIRGFAVNELSDSRASSKVTSTYADEPTYSLVSQKISSLVSAEDVSRSTEGPKRAATAAGEETDRTRIGKLTRTYSQRSQNRETASKVVTKIPERLVIPGRLDDMDSYSSQASLEALPVDAVIAASDSLQSIVGQRDDKGQTYETPQLLGDAHDTINEEARRSSIESLQPTSVEQIPHEAGILEELLDEHLDLSDAEEVPSVVAVCTRISLQRSTVLSTPKRASRPLSEKQSRQSLQSTSELAMLPRFMQPPGKIPANGEISISVDRRSGLAPGKLPAYMTATAIPPKNEKPLPGKLQVPDLGTSSVEPKVSSAPGKLTVSLDRAERQQSASRTLPDKLTLTDLEASPQQQKHRRKPGKLQLQALEGRPERARDEERVGKLSARTVQETEWKPANKEIPGKLQMKALDVSQQVPQARATPGKLSEQNFEPKLWVPKGRASPGKLPRHPLQSKSDAPIPQPLRNDPRRTDRSGTRQSRAPRLPIADAEVEVLSPKVDSIEMNGMSGDGSDHTYEHLDEACNSTSQEHSDSDSRPCATSESSASASLSQPSTMNLEIANHRDSLPSEKHITINDDVDKENRALSDTPAEVRRKRSHTLRPLRLQDSRSATSTPKKPAVSVADSTPYTTRSELWSPNASAPAHSTLTDATSVSQPRSNSSRRVRGRSGTIMNADSVDSHRTSGLISPEDQWLQRQMSASPNGSPTSAYHKSAPPPPLGLRRTTTASVGAAESSHSRRERTSLFAPPLSPSPRTTRPQPPEASNPIMPAFEISFQLTEPKTIPECSNGTILEFGLRVCIKPNATSSSTPPAVRIRPDPGSRTSTPPPPLPIDSFQYEYSQLSSNDMAQVQRAAQEQLRQSFTSPRSSAEHLFPSPSPSGLGLGLGLEAEARGRSYSASHEMRELTLPRRRQVSESQYKRVSSARSGGKERASPLPYIKRATPRRSVSSAGRSQA